MSTSYYYLKAPFTKISVRVEGNHAKIKFWESGAYAGELTVRAEALSEVAFALSSTRCPVKTHWDDNRGCVVDECVPGLDQGLTLISEDGDVLTVGQIRALAGKRKQTEARSRQHGTRPS